MYKLIACDLDETLLNENKMICERNIQAIRKAGQEYGVKFVPATGRGYTCIDEVLTTLQTKNAIGEYIISNNGGIVCENKGFEKLSFHTLGFNKVKELFKFGMQKNVCIQIFTDEDVYAFHLNEDEANWLFMFKPDSIICEEESIEFLRDVPIVKMLFQNTDTEYLDSLAFAMEHITKEHVSVSFSSSRYIELNAIGVDKGLGLSELANHLGIPMEETMAIGDNYNDVEMLKVAGLAVAVANANETIKEVADYVCVDDHNQGGVAEAIEKFIFQEGA